MLKRLLSLGSIILTLPLMISADNPPSPELPKAAVVIPPQAPAETAKLTLTAQGTIRKPADELQMKIGAVSLSEKAESALTDNSDRMQAIVKNLELAGLPRSDYETGNFSIHPTYTPVPQDAPPDWKPSINGYEVSNSILIHTDKLDIAGRLIDAANKAGANTIDNIHFVLHDSRTGWDEAIRTATLNAISDASIIAKAANVELDRILEVSLQNINTVMPRSNSMFLAKSSGGETPIESREVNINATVSITYEISKMK